MIQDEKNSFVMYTEWMQVFEQLPAEECQKLLLAVISYAQTGNAPVLDGMAAMAFTFIRGQLDRDAKKWEEVKKQRSEAGKRSAEVRKERKELNNVQRTSTELNTVQRTSTELNEAQRASTNSTVYVDVNADVDEDVNVDADEGVNVNADENVNVNDTDNVNETDNHTDNCQLSTVNCQLKSSATAPESVPSSHSSSFSSREKEKESETVDSGQCTVDSSCKRGGLSHSVDSGQWTVDSSYEQTRRTEAATQNNRKRSENNCQLSTVNCQLPNVNCQLNDEFDELWQLYPKERRQGRSKALSAYIKARKKGVEYESVKTALERYVKQISIERTEPRYIKQAVTWFSNEPWNDEYHTEEQEKDPWAAWYDDVHTKEWAEKFAREHTILV